MNNERDPQPSTTDRIEVQKGASIPSLVMITNGASIPQMQSRDIERGASVPKMQSMATGQNASSSEANQSKGREKNG
ncbi:MAG: hypothetical protein JNK57_10910 [Planctomycetaceae bacterium]|nr:hypothetical protein [Planctomycetaceae bacterium]